MAKNVCNSPAIALVGHMCKDEILTPAGTLKTAIGGTAYNLAALASVMKDGSILPVCRLGSDMKALAMPLFSLSERIDTSGVLHSRFPNVIHRLTYLKNGERAEWNSGKQTPLPLGDICHSADAILLNFISGSDVRLAELKRFKKSYKGIIYSDFHSLSLGYNKDQIRYHRHHPYWKEYISELDMLQMNIGELRTIFGDPLVSPDDVIAVISDLHSLGPAVINITMGSQGVIVSQPESGLLRHIPGVRIQREVDPTGCGDTFAAVFLVNYLLSGDVLVSAQQGARYAAAKATFSGLDGFRNIHDIVSGLGE
jgi:sugar/nucleoside kinase (ribokinase family)